MNTLKTSIISVILSITSNALLASPEDAYLLTQLDKSKPNHEVDAIYKAAYPGSHTFMLYGNEFGQQTKVLYNNQGKVRGFAIYGDANVNTPKGALKKRVVYTLDVNPDDAPMPPTDLLEEPTQINKGPGSASTTPTTTTPKKLKMMQWTPSLLTQALPPKSKTQDDNSESTILMNLFEKQAELEGIQVLETKNLSKMLTPVQTAQTASSATSWTAWLYNYLSYNSN